MYSGTLDLIQGIFIISQFFLSKKRHLLIKLGCIIFGVGKVKLLSPNIIIKKETLTKFL